MNLEGSQQLLGVYPSPRGPLTSTATFLSLHAACRLPSSHEFIQKHQGYSSCPQAGDSLSMPMMSQPCSCSLWVSLSTGVWSVGIFHPRLPMPWARTHPHIFPHLHHVPAQTCSQRCGGGEYDPAGSQSLTTHLSLLSHSAFRPFTCLPCGWAEMPPYCLRGKPNPRGAGEPFPWPRCLQWGLWRPQERSQCSPRWVWVGGCPACGHFLPLGEARTTPFWSRVCSSPGHLCTQPGPGSAAGGGRLGHC